MQPDFTKMPILKAVLSSLRQGVAIFSPDRKLLYINPAMAEVTGGGERSVGGALSQLAQKHRLRTVGGVPLEPKDFPIERAFLGEDSFDEPYLYVSPEGRHLWLSVSCFRILDESGAVQYVATTISNISERKSREDKLEFMLESAKILSITADFRKRLTEKARLAVPSLADWCAIDILDGKKLERVVVVHSDPKKLAYLEEFQKKYPPDLSAPTSVYNVIRRQETQYIPIVTDEMIRGAAQSPEHLEAIRKLELRSVIVVPIVVRGRELGALTLAYAESGRTYSEEDVRFFEEYCAHLGNTFDNARLYDAIQKRDKAKDMFLASLSHELRNPLAPIRSALELIKIKGLPPEVIEDVTIIEHQFDHMARLLGDLLDVTRFTHAKITVNMSRMEVRRVVERALKAIDPLVRNADITLHFTYPSTALEIEADETRIEQAVTNLISNAIKFTPAGGSIWVDIEKSDDTCVFIKVRDNGAGIDERDMPNIFDMYYQGSHTRDSASTGLGIGLLLVKKIVELHGGEIRATSEGRGKGSEFVMSLPLATPAGHNNLAPRKSGDVNGMRILVVDDNIHAADSLVKLLNRVGAKAEALYSGEETLATSVDKFDVLLLDVGMPRMDGYELVRELRRRGTTLPIVALTGYGMADDREKAKKAGFSSHLTKPIGLKELTTTIESLPRG